MSYFYRVPSLQNVTDVGASTDKLINSTLGFYNPTTGGSAAQITSNSYFGAITGSTSGIYFNNVAPRAIELHLAGVLKYKWCMGNAGSEGVVGWPVRTSDPTGIGMPLNGGLCVVNTSGDYRLKLYNPTFTAWQDVGSQWLNYSPAASGLTALGVGGPVLDDSTFDGGVGGSAYTIQDIVAALKLIGTLAA